MKKIDNIDYSITEMTIQQAKIAQVKRFNKNCPEFLIWSDLKIKTSDIIDIKNDCVIQIRFLNELKEANQGVDIKAYNGWIELENGNHVTVLRTWNDPDYEPVLKYKIHTKDGKLGFWNVFKVKYDSQQIVEEKWTENAGFWIEKKSNNKFIYHCSPGWSTPPDFESLVVEILVL